MIEGTSDSAQLFDLNIEEVLEHWEIEHAIREVIANALDEQLLSSSAEVQISEDGQGTCRIRDFGRGLAISHFTLNENEEKLAGTPGVIGKFGVGLKDALATFHRRGVGVTIRSRHGVFRLREASKHNFEGITTLHVEWRPGSAEMQGTEFELNGVPSADLETAKALFLRFSGEERIESTPYGEILRRDTGPARVYISGVLAAEEPNFLFSYNITSLTKTMRKRLNRERLNVGRTTYAERIKAILKASETEGVAAELVAQIAARSRGVQADEMQWIEVSQRALNLLHDRRRVAFVTEQEMALHPHVVDNMRGDHLEVVVVDEVQKGKLAAQREGGDSELRTLEGYVDEYNKSFDYRFVEPAALSVGERAVLSQVPSLLAAAGLTPEALPSVRISETMRVGLDSTNGVWDTELEAIVIKRDQLTSLERFAAVLLHEAAHAMSGAVDATREFETVLTTYLGRAAVAALGAK